ncbi:MAG: hypothetical protein WCL14_11655 [Bacteroidota bacterium]
MFDGRLLEMAFIKQRGCGEKASPFRRSHIMCQTSFEATCHQNIAPIVAAARCLVSAMVMAAATADSGTGHDTRGGYRLLERVMSYELFVMSGGKTMEGREIWQMGRQICQHCNVAWELPKGEIR